MPDFTYAGLREIGRPRKGETAVVAAAAGPAGSLVGQLAKLDGARAVGIAGGVGKWESFRMIAVLAAVASVGARITALATIGDQDSAVHRDIEAVS